MASLSNIYSFKAKDLFSPQYTALTEKKPRIPLAAIIHAQTPAYKAAKEVSVEKQMEEEALGQEQEQFEEEMKLRKAEQAETAAYHTEAQKQAEKATKVSGASVGAATGAIVGYAAAGGGAAAGAQAGAQAGTAVSPGVGTAVGAVIGGVLGYVASGTVLCTELHRRGLLPDEIYQADCEYAKSIPEVVKIGYRIWARYLVLAMQKSKLVTRLLTPLVRAWAYQMAYKMGVVEKGSRLGALLEWAGVPICKMIGETIVKNLSIIDSAKKRYFNFNLI